MLVFFGIIILITTATSYFLGYGIPLHNEERTNLEPKSYKVSGRVVLSMVEGGYQRIFRFFNDLEGDIVEQEETSFSEASGSIEVRLEKPDKDSTTIIAPEGVFLERLFAAGVVPVAAIQVENIVGLRNHNLPIGNSIRGIVQGDLKVMGINHPFNLPVRISHHHAEEYIVESIEGVSLNVEDPQLNDEVAYLMGADQNSIEKVLRIYFKLFLS